MSSFFIEFKDPLFGIIVFFVLVFVITFFSYWWARFRAKEDNKHLDKFLQAFRSVPSQDELSGMIQKGEFSEKSWLLLASAYFKNGEYERSIEIYTELLRVGEKKNYRDTLFLLGKTYFKAGFLARAKEIFLKILQKNPRTPQALEYLVLVYEHMREYKEALDALEPLEELGCDVSKARTYLKVLSLLNNFQISDEQKRAKILKIHKESQELTYMIFEYLFRIDAKAAWDNYKSSYGKVLIDVLWRLDKKDIDMQIVRDDSFLMQLYTARGDIAEAGSSDIFELDVLIKLGKNAAATLSFEYSCSECKVVFPFAFYRCSNCHAIDSSSVELALTKDYYRDFGEENNSFQ